MTGLYFLAALVGVLYIVWWSIKNDAVESIDQQTGLLRMSVPEKKKKAAAPVLYGSASPTDQDPPEQDQPEQDQEVPPHRGP